jgi:hypothetical protein
VTFEPPLSAPPARVIAPPEEESETLVPVVILPELLLSESDHNVIDPPAVVTETELAIATFPDAFRTRLPELVKLALTVAFPPVVVKVKWLFAPPCPVTAWLTVMSPVLSIVVLRLANEVCNVVVLMVDAAAEFAIHRPSTKDPLTSEDVLTVTVVGSVLIDTESVTEE